LFLQIEDNDVILMENIVALVRMEGRTVITLGDGGIRESSLTPPTLDRRSSRFVRGGGARGTGRVWTIRTEGN
jgi:hypothetical protein